MATAKVPFSAATGRTLRSAPLPCEPQLRSFQPLRVPYPGLSDGRTVGRRDPRFQVPPDSDRLLTVASVDALTVLNKLRFVSRLRASAVAWAAHLVPLTDHLRVEHSRVLRGKNLACD